MFGLAQVRGIIFDLDQTLVDSRIAEPLRRSRSWGEVYRLIPQFPVYEGIKDLFRALSRNGIGLSVVTSAPSAYCSRVLAVHGLAANSTVCYHDTNRHKPAPEPMELALRNLGLQASEVLSVGDEPKDSLAAKSAGILAIGALWGCLDRTALRASGCSVLCETTTDLVGYFHSVGIL
jgi:HAD superfamily hydrolase (TIGR01549 family)